ncbi:hypothetical protein H6F75_03555 [Nodosilinea sp. FACHB-131]|uniref:hypothetical protein n=1 Tax=Cyanophyceae TaxID=3028117 RepID=UPI001686DB6C|nr:hypothetical protein [Nodosilinea sp. FACHB-131]MBD1872549.1 hypothetical protein [Nodosilinea sp. FACHB-131]MBW4458858.1 hypothetical protein [Nodosilinea sp. WJT8-NPBG4]
MLGTFQHSHLRIEVNANHEHIQASLVQPSQFRRWLWPQQFSQGLPGKIHSGLSFNSYLGPVEIHHDVKHVNDHSLYMVLSGGIDGFHEWYWGDQWVQSRLEGVSALPLNLGQSLVMARLRQFLQQPTL